MVDVAKHRQFSFESTSTPTYLSTSITEGVKFGHYTYPYHDFPVIISHIDPKFVIFDVIKKLDVDYGRWISQNNMFREEFLIMEQIFIAWIDENVPPGKFRSKGSSQQR